MAHALPARMITVAVGLAALTLVLSAARTTPPPSTAADPWIVYVFDESGNYQGRGTVDHPLADGSRWACRRGGGCSPCVACHTTSQTEDRTYVARYDNSRHKTVHYPRLAVSLSPGQSVAWGRGASLRKRNTEFVITNSDGSKDVMLFPAGSLVLRDPQGTARLVLLPQNLAPRLP